MACLLGHSQIPVKKFLIVLSQRGWRKFPSPLTQTLKKFLDKNISFIVKEVIIREGKVLMSKQQLTFWWWWSEKGGEVCP
jgi:hypothetical protein